MKAPVPAEQIARRIFFIRGHRVMISTDLAALYEVEPRALVQAIKRNKERFPNDFMFQLTAKEFRILKSQIVISSWGGLRRTTPYAFTEQGVAMLSGVLKSHRAVRVNIAIMRAFVRLRNVLASNREFARRMAALERHVKDHDVKIGVVFDAIRELMEPAIKPPPRQIGFILPSRQENEPSGYRGRIRRQPE